LAIDVPAERLTPAFEWLPSSPGAIILLLAAALVLSWWLTGRFFKERDLTTLVFRILISLLICFALGLFHRALFSYVREGPLARTVETRDEQDDRLRENLQQWVTPAACESYWKPVATDLAKRPQMSPAERREFDANHVDSAILVESAVRGLTWMALEYQQPSKFGRNKYLHAERGTKVLNNLTPAQTQAMFDYLRLVSPASAQEARQHLADALAYAREGSPPGETVRPAGEARERGEKKPAPSYPFVEIRRPTAQGRVAFVVRMSPTVTRIIEASSEEEALQKAKQR